MWSGELLSFLLVGDEARTNPPSPEDLPSSITSILILSSLLPHIDFSCSSPTVIRHQRNWRPETGKSSLLLRFTDDDFLSEEETAATIGVDFKVKSLEVDGRKYKLSIWVSLVSHLLGGIGVRGWKDLRRYKR